MEDNQINLPKIPTALVKHNGKEYKWMVPSFKLPGYQGSFISEDVSEDSFILDKILDIDGQGLLVEQF